MVGAAIALFWALSTTSLDALFSRDEYHQINGSSCNTLFYTLKFQSDGRIQWTDNTVLTPEESIRRLTAEYAQNPEGEVALYAPPDFPLVLAQNFMDRMSEMGWRRVHLASIVPEEPVAAPGKG